MKCNQCGFDSDMGERRQKANQEYQRKVVELRPMLTDKRIAKLQAKAGKLTKQHDSIYREIEKLKNKIYFFPLRNEWKRLVKKYNLG